MFGGIENLVVDHVANIAFSKSNCYIFTTADMYMTESMFSASRILTHKGKKNIGML